MKKIIIFVITLALILSMAVTAYAVTPAMKVPNMPEIPDISDDVEIELPDDFWDNYFEEHPLMVPETVEAERMELPAVSTAGWKNWLRDWYRWWSCLSR